MFVGIACTGRKDKMAVRKFCAGGNTMVESLKVSVITVVFNGAGTIEQTIKSVLGQTYKNIEYIIIDGDSTDGTQEIVETINEQI